MPRASTLRKAGSKPAKAIKAEAADRPGDWRSEAAQKAWGTKRAKATDYRRRALKAWKTKRAKREALEQELARQLATANETRA